MRTLLLAVLLVQLLVAHASAQCRCDHTLGLDVTTANGASLGIGPGDRVCVTSGARSFLRLEHFVGTAAEPITVLNCGGVVDIRNTDRAYALVIEDASAFVRVTGSGEEGVPYGFRVSAPDEEPYAGVGVWILGRSTDIEVDHMEIYETGFAGLMAKTDPSCDDRPFWDGFVQRNTHLHHLWVHDTGGEGFYIGSTQSAGYNRMCSGAMVNIPAHFLEGVDVHDVRIEDTGWDGIQIGFARRDCSFHDSVVHRVGLRGVEFQVQGLQIGSFSSCSVRRNDLRDGPAMGIIVLESGDSTFADNVIARFAADGIYANPRMAPVATWNFVHNTIVNSGGSAIRVFGGGDGIAANNLVIGGAASTLSVPAGIMSMTNVFAANTGAAGVVGTDDFHLTDGASSRGVGTDLRALGYELDLDRQARAAPPSVGAYEHMRDAPDAGPVDAGRLIITDDAFVDASVSITVDARVLVGVDAGTAPATSSGCACRVAPGATASWLATWSLAALGLCVSVRRRRTQR